MSKEGAGATVRAAAGGVGGNGAEELEERSDADAGVDAGGQEREVRVGGGWGFKLVNLLLDRPPQAPALPYSLAGPVSRRAEEACRRGTEAATALREGPRIARESRSKVPASRSSFQVQLQGSAGGGRGRVSRFLQVRGGRGGEVDRGYVDIWLSPACPACPACPRLCQDEEARPGYYRCGGRSLVGTGTVSVGVRVSTRSTLFLALGLFAEGHNMGMQTVVIPMASVRPALFLSDKWMRKTL